MSQNKIQLIFSSQVAPFVPHHVNTILQTKKDSGDLVQRRLRQVMAGETHTHHFQPGRAAHA